VSNEVASTRLSAAWMRSRCFAALRVALDLWTLKPLSGLHCISHRLAFSCVNKNAHAFQIQDWTKVTVQSSDVMLCDDVSPKCDVYATDGSSLSLASEWQLRQCRAARAAGQQGQCGSPLLAGE